MAQSQVVAIRRGRASGLDLSVNIRILKETQDKLQAIGGGLADSWTNVNVPIFLAYTDLIVGDSPTAINALITLAESGNTSALWYRGIGLVRTGAIETGVIDLERNRRGFHRERRAEGRGALLVALGDAYQMLGRADDATSAYVEAGRQPIGMDNLDAVKVAKQRLSNRGGSVMSPPNIFLP
jgi:hypothetical protein